MSAQAELRLSDLYHSHILSFETQPSAFIRKIKALQQGKTQKVRIVQFGDSHTAGEYMSDVIRQTLQQKWGNGGIGWIFPNEIKGQRQSQVTYHATGWQSVRHASLGGAMMRSNGLSVQQIGARQESAEPYTITLMFKALTLPSALTISFANRSQPLGMKRFDDSWQLEEVTGSLPFTLISPNEEKWEVGLISLENQRSGVVYSALGMNGAQFAHWQKWEAWQALLAQTQADLVILAYGTNKAFDTDFDAHKMMALWRKQIREIKQVLPEVSILILGAPEALLKPPTEALSAGIEGKEALSASNHNDESLSAAPSFLTREQRCGLRSSALSAVQQVQFSVAKQEHTLFWSWENAMSEVIPGEDPCLMKEWMAQNLASKDGVHFSAQGYQQLGRQLAEALLDFIDAK